MTPEQQQVAIAEACGWRLHTVAKDDPYTCTHCGIHYSPMLWRAWEIPYQWCNKNNEAQPPNYQQDLNAMHEAEKVLTVAQRITYANQIGVVLSGGSVGRAIPNWWFIHEATAIQRAEAFLRTIGKWEKEDKL